MFENIRPLYDRVLVKKNENGIEEKSAAGIILTSAPEENKATQYGVVIAVGEGRRTDQGTFIPLSVKVGDTVFFIKYTGTEANEGHIILREGEILAVINK